MLAQFGHGLVLVENARTLARDFMGDLALVPECLFRDWANLGFRAILLEKIWRQPGGNPGGVEAFVPDDSVGGSRGLQFFRRNASDAGLELILDFPPFQVAQINPLSELRPDWTIHQPFSPGMEMEKDAWYLSEVEAGRILAIARARDPYFPPVPGSAQLNPCQPGLREHMQSVLARIATLCDGAWFSSAMLPLPAGVEKAWGKWRNPSLGGAILDDSPWPCLLDSARDISPEFKCLAEGFWGSEWDLMGQGFNYCLDQRLTKRLAEHNYEGVMAHLSAPWEYLKHTLHQWKEVIDSCEVHRQQDAILAWVAFLASPGLKLVENQSLNQLLGAGMDEGGRYSNPFATALNNSSMLNADCEFRLIEFPGKRNGFDGDTLGFVWTRRESGKNGWRHLLFLARLQGQGETELVLDLDSAICKYIRPNSKEGGLGAKLGEWRGDHFHVVLQGSSPVFWSPVN